MARPLRRWLPDGVFHVSITGVDECAIFRDAGDRLRLLELLGDAVADHAWLVHALSLLGNHYHLVVEATQPALSRGLHRVHGAYGREFNRKYERKGHLFGDRFFARAVDVEGDDFAGTIEYVRWNPVRHGFCERPDDWPWTWVRTATAAAVGQFPGASAAMR